jgi:predicted phosphodiesterase
MRYLVLTDIHANLPALEEVLEVAAAEGYDRVLVLGDLVGYGADPNAVIDRVKALSPAAIIRGNHDKASSGLHSADDFNAVARAAATWTFNALSPENRDFLRTLPAGPVQVTSRLEICHGTPFDEDAYVFDAADAIDALDAAHGPLCFYGHTHLPVVFSRSASGFNVALPTGATSAITLEDGTRYLVNPGSVGQPRDGDARAAFAIYDEDASQVTFWRVPYPIGLAQEAILAAGLPAPLAARLAVGR